MKRPELVYDGECGFCRLWIERWRLATGDKVAYEPYQTAAARHKSVPPEEFTKAVHLFEGNRTSRGAEAVFRSLAYAPGLSWLPRVYFAPLAEPVYRFVAARRPFFSRVTRLLWGKSPVPAQVGFTARMVLGGIGLCYLFAFASLIPQIRGLIGSDGLMPAAGMLTAAKAQMGAARYWLFPSVAWMSASDRALSAYCWLGAFASLGLIFDIAAAPSAVVCWILYLSLSAIGADFMSFQWDALLLEAGLIACFLAPWRTRGTLWLMRLLLLKLMLQSGLVKLFSGDPSWRDLSALSFHYLTQPLPTPLAWWFSRMPLWAHKVSCLCLFVIELVAPILILFPRHARAAGAAAIAALMLIIAATGNYGFFNVITVVLCLSCLDDRFFHRDLPAPAKTAAPKARPRIIGALAVLSITIGLFETLSIIGIVPPAPVRAVIAAVSPSRSFNRYGLFAVMTRSRDEIVVEISSDGTTWHEYPFLYKPGDPLRAPAIVAPHMPRLDWQCWFAALADPGDSPWFGNLLYRLLEGSPSVKGLLGPDPLRGEKPLFIRAVRYETKFAPAGGPAWWSRERRALFFPVVSLTR